MAQRTLPEMTTEVSRLMRERLGIRRGRTLAAKMRWGGRLLPRKLRQEAMYLVDSEARMGHPKMQRMIDQRQVKNSFRALEKHLKSIDPMDRLKGRVLGILAGLSFNLLLLFAGVVIYLVYTGAL